MEAGQDWADKLAAADLLEGSLKTLRAQLTTDNRFQRQCSMAEAGEWALCDKKYTNALEASVEARRDANRARVRYDATKALFEAQRTVEASERAAMRAAT